MHWSNSSCSLMTSLLLSDPGRGGGLIWASPRAQPPTHPPTTGGLLGSPGPPVRPNPPPIPHLQPHPATRCSNQALSEIVSHFKERALAGTTNAGMWHGGVLRVGPDPPPLPQEPPPPTGARGEVAGSKHRPKAEPEVVGSNPRWDVVGDTPSHAVACRRGVPIRYGTRAPDIRRSSAGPCTSYSPLAPTAPTPPHYHCTIVPLHVPPMLPHTGFPLHCAQIPPCCHPFPPHPRVFLNNSASPGGGGVRRPPPFDPDFTVRKNEILQKEILMWLFWYTKFWTFGFQDPPPPSNPTS